ncbi:MAG TPA: glycosyltransferase family 4 protein [Ktedonobacterales bacterium]|nr:glycosyltransferase family 4 protein [Ktedonobacterales bacterium]
MNVLVVCSRIPRPTWGAGTRNYALLRALAARHRVALLALVDGDDPDLVARDTSHLAGLASPIRLVQVPGGHGKRLRQLAAVARGRSYQLDECSPRTAAAPLAELLAAEHFDAVLFESALTAGYPVPSGTHVIVDQHNLEYELVRRTFEQERNGPRKWYAALEYRALCSAELERCRRADAVTVTSERERRILAELLPGTPVAVVPNGVDVGAFTPAAPEEEVPGRVVFTGTLGYHPNVQAVLHFARACWPRIRAELPDAEWQVVGSYPPAEVQRLAELPGVTVTGTVPAVQPYLRAASVAVVPLLVGGGTRLKILEALATGKAVVTTAVGCEGLALTPGEHALIEDDPDAFAAAVVALLRDPARRAALGAAGRALVEARYGWERCAEPLLAVLETLGAAERGRAGTETAVGVRGGRI